jgi:hypothetical protein
MKQKIVGRNYINGKKLLTTIGIGLLALASPGFAGDIYRLTDANFLITANQGDLEILMALNQRHLKQAVRNYYSQLLARGACFNLQPGTLVEVSWYYGDGTAKIEWGNGEYRGYINKEDLSIFVGSRHRGDNAVGIWENESNA